MNLCSVKIIGITGGIGSGKSTVCNIFRALGAPVFDADSAAKNAYDNPLVRAEVSRVFGTDLFASGSLNRPLLAERVFSDPTALQKLNEIIHPEVRSIFSEWLTHQSGTVPVIREAAILFESGTYRDCDETILVTAPTELRIARVQKRDGLSAEMIRTRMNNQWDDERKRALATHEIINDDRTALVPQCLALWNQWISAT